MSGTLQQPQQVVHGIVVRPVMSLVHLPSSEVQAEVEEHSHEHYHLLIRSFQDLGLEFEAPVALTGAVKMPTLFSRALKQ